MKRLTLMVAGLTLSVSAWALVSPSAIQQKMEQAVALEAEGKSVQAKQLYENAIKDLDEVIEAKKTNAKAHYWKSQALVHLNRFEEAQKELNAAKQYDPLLRFGSSKAIDDLQGYILKNQKRNNYEASSSGTQSKSNHAGLSDQNQRISKENKKEETIVQSHSSQSSPVAVVLITFAVLGLMFGGGYWLTSIMNRKKEAAQYEEKKKKMMARAVNQKTQAQEYADMAKFENVLDKPFGQKAVSMNASIAQDIQDIKEAANGQALSLLEQNLEQNARQLRELEAAASIRHWNLINKSKENQEESMSQEAHGAFRQSTNPTYGHQNGVGNSGVGGSSQPTTVIHEHHTTHVDSSPSLLQTMILVDALRSNDHHASYREREQEREIERLNRRLDEEREERRDQQERDSRDSAPSFDFGRQEPEREAPPFDFGSNNDSPPPMDFGSDSSSSSSSSSSGSDSWD